MDKDAILTGIIAGMIMPVIGFFVIEGLFDIATNMGVMDYVDASTSDKRMRTMALIGLCFNIIPMHFFKHKNAMESMRGIVFPTLIYVGLWLYKYYAGLGF